MSDLNEIKLDEGLIFVRKLDSVSQLFTSVTKQHFSSIGVFYKDAVSGDIIVYLREVTGMERPGYLATGLTMQELINDPLVEEIKIRRLKPLTKLVGTVDNAQEVYDEFATEGMRISFRLSINKIVSQCEYKSMTEFIMQLLGQRIPEETSGYTAVEMVSKIIQDMGSLNEFPQSSERVVLDQPEHLDTDNLSKAKAVGYFSAPMNQLSVHNPGTGNLRLAAYLESSDLFEALEDVAVSTHTDVEIQLALKDISELQGPWLEEFVTTFVRLFQTDTEFSQTFIAGFNETLDSNNKFHRKTANLLSESNDQTRYLLNYLNKVIKSHVMYGKDLEYAKTQFNIMKTKIETLLGGTIGPGTNLEIPCKKSIINVLPDKGAKDLVYSAVYDLRLIFKQISDDFVDDVSPEIGLNDIILRLNAIIKGMDYCDMEPLPYVAEKACIPATICTGGDCLKLNIGSKKIKISCQHPNLNGYSANEVKNIMCTVDSIGGQKYSTILKACSDHIASSSTGNQ